MPKGPVRIDELAGAGKLYYACCAAWVLGKPMSARVVGNMQQMQALSEAIRETRAFDALLMSEGATVEKVVEQLDRKRDAAQKFQRACGVPWPV